MSIDTIDSLTGMKTLSRLLASCRGVGPEVVALTRKLWPPCARVSTQKCHVWYLQSVLSCWIAALPFTCTCSLPTTHRNETEANRFCQAPFDVCTHIQLHTHKLHHTSVWLPLWAEEICFKQSIRCFFPTCVTCSCYCSSCRCFCFVLGVLTADAVCFLALRCFDSRRNRFITLFTVFLPPLFLPSSSPSLCSSHSASFTSLRSSSSSFPVTSSSNSHYFCSLFPQFLLLLHLPLLIITSRLPPLPLAKVHVIYRRQMRLFFRLAVVESYIYRTFTEVHFKGDLVNVQKF